MEKRGTLEVGDQERGVAADKEMGCFQTKVLVNRNEQAVPPRGIEKGRTGLRKRAAKSV